MNTDCQNNCAVDELCVPSNVASVILTSWTCMKIPSKFREKASKFNVIVTYTPKTNTRHGIILCKIIHRFGLADGYHLLARTVTNEQSLMLSFKLRESGRVYL